MEPKDWQGVAFNQATASENKIHSDEVARRYGFRGGLVPGVTVFAYLVHPGLAAWGRDWLERGTAEVVLAKPLYDRGEFRVAVEADGKRGYRGEVRDEGGVAVASGKVALPEAPDETRPVRRGDPQLADRGLRPEATRAALERLREQGMGALRLQWRGGELGRYVRQLEQMPATLRPDGEGLANPAFTLGLANSALGANVLLGPWIHVQSELRNYAAIPPDARLVVESRVVELFDRGGHEFVDLDVSVFLEPDTPAMRASHRAIYKLREPSSAG